MRNIILCIILLFFSLLPFMIGVAIETLFSPRWSSDTHGLIFFLCIFLDIAVLGKVTAMVVPSQHED